MPCRLKTVAAAMLIAATGACTAPAPTPKACAPGTGTAMAVFTLYMGEAIPNRPDLTDREWQSFLDDTVSAALPDGFTVLDARGAWLNPRTHRTAQEATKVLIAALPDTPNSLAAINRVRDAYQARFHQQFVGMTVALACASF